MKILLRNQSIKKWEPIDSADYSAEHELQRLLAETPSLIPISEIRENSSQLVAAVQEVGLPGSGTTDILAFSSEGNIAVVECKLSANTDQA
jgi:RecB family endonuclease NucS